tara:strand:+ start:670 stop:984 length:315 start_codon:yes stop_codon:yes gene_type:complete
MTSGEFKLVQFAIWTLECLEESEDWSADTLAAIDQRARDCGLVDLDSGMFRVEDYGPIFKDDTIEMESGAKCTMEEYREVFMQPKVGAIGRFGRVSFLVRLKGR